MCLCSCVLVWVCIYLHGSVMGGMDKIIELFILGLGDSVMNYSLS